MWMGISKGNPGEARVVLFFVIWGVTKSWISIVDFFWGRRKDLENKWRTLSLIWDITKYNDKINVYYILTPSRST